MKLSKLVGLSGELIAIFMVVVVVFLMVSDRRRVPTNYDIDQLSSMESKCRESHDEFMKCNQELVNHVLKGYKNHRWSSKDGEVYRNLCRKRINLINQYNDKCNNYAKEASKYDLSSTNLSGVFFTPEDSNPFSIKSEVSKKDIEEAMSTPPSPLQ